MRERKELGTLQVITMAWKFNSKQLLYKTLNSRMNIIETRAVLNMGSGGQTGGPGINPKVFFALIFNFNQLCIM